MKKSDMSGPRGVASYLVNYLQVQQQQQPFAYRPLFKWAFP